MFDGTTGTKLQQIHQSCYLTRNREGEQFIPEHVFGYQVSGTLTMTDSNKEYFFKEGDFRLSRRNHLVKFVKQPPANGEFKAISVYLDQTTLRNFSIEHGFKAEGHSTNTDAVIQLKSDPLYKSYMDSLLPYYNSLQPIRTGLQTLKIMEAIMILLQANPDLKNILFDCSEPGKIDQEAFMNKNFYFNVKLKRFAYLTGRSIATFKRDFEKIFPISPSRWLLQRRLQEAHYLIREKG